MRECVRVCAGECECVRVCVGERERVRARASACIWLSRQRVGAKKLLGTDSARHHKIQATPAEAEKLPGTAAPDALRVRSWFSRQWFMNCAHAPGSRDSGS